jgi:very-short-patch-repair endonuclease
MKYLNPIEFARRLRKMRTSSEDYLWQFVRNRQRCGKKFRRQRPLASYTADFYCIEARLAIEVDGEPHLTAEGKQKDEARDKWMLAQGIEVLRFGGHQVENEIQQVLETTDNALQRRCPPS